MDVVEDLANPFVQPMLDIERESTDQLFSNITLLSLLINSLTTKRNKHFAKTKNRFKREYDYIIVGAGSAGSVMANRLSQKPCVRVLLLEAGDNPYVLTEVPAMPRLLYGTSIDWLYKTTPQKYGAFAQNENRVNMNSGKALGGTSVLNAMLYVRGNKKNYDDWEAEGAKGWSFKDVLPYLKKLEDNRNIEELDEGYHSTGGPVTMEKPRYTPEFKEPLLKAMKGLGLELTDSNGARQTGIYDLQGTLRNGQRCSSVKAYLVPAEDRPNLDILKRAFVKKILIRDKRAYGVEFDFQGRTRTVFAAKEVIVSNGALRTPQLLMLSGIGPKEELEKFKIPIVKELPVGKSFQDHCTTTLNFVINNTIPLGMKALNPLNVLNYMLNRSGVFASPNQVTLITFLNGLNTTATSTDFPKQEILFAEYSTLDARRNYNLKPGVYDQVFKPYEGKPLFTCFVSLLQPKSVGEITLQSTDPYDPPVINPNYYMHESDVKDMVEGMKACKAIATSKEMQKIGSRMFETSYPGCEKFIGDDDKYFACHAKSVINSFWHYTGTARMGDPKDPRSVVDPQLRVIGVDGLRVVNAAVMPIVPSGHTHIPTMMVAEKVYDMMKDDIQCTRRFPEKSFFGYTL